MCNKSQQDGVKNTQWDAMGMENSKERMVKNY